ncbi:MAG TPA: DUF72 domain-containing protein [Candidatus Eremiobacteraceae bacterium]
MPGRLHVGCMGWQEKDWIGPVYPAETKPPDMLALYAHRFSSVEVDSTFYGRPRESTVVAWRDAAPEDFKFALKVSREVTHKKHFEDAGQSFTWFVDRARLLGPRLGALLLQCGGDFRPTPANKTRLYTFLDEHLPPDVNTVLELRHREWFDDALFEAARSQRFALAATEGPHSSLELAERVLDEQGSELGFAYARLMGLTAFEHYDRVQVDRSESLDVWARLLAKARHNVDDLFVYVSDDYAGHSPATVEDLVARIEALS